MEQKKVWLPREVAEALEEEKENGDHGGDIEYIAWRIPQWAHEDGHRRVLFEFSGQGNGFFSLIDALRYGYEVEPEPITVTITPEMQEQIKTWYEAHQEDADSHYRIGFVTALGLCGIKISGVNE